MGQRREVLWRLGRLEKLGKRTGHYRSVLIKKLWPVDQVLGQRERLHGAAGHPGEHPRAGVARQA